MVRSVNKYWLTWSDETGIQKRDMDWNGMAWLMQIQVTYLPIRLEFIFTHVLISLLYQSAMLCYIYKHKLHIPSLNSLLLHVEIKYFISHKQSSIIKSWAVFIMNWINKVLTQCVKINKWLTDFNLNISIRELGRNCCMRH